MNYHSKGGIAASAKLTKEERKLRSKLAIETRWKKQKGENWNAPLPTATYKGVGLLGSDEIECYVLSNRERVLSLRQAVRLITGQDTGDLASYIGQSGLKSLICKKNVAAESVDFLIPGNPQTAKGIKGDTFADICAAYVEAAYRELLTTPKQRKIALKCSFLQSGFMKIGITAFIDEVTGFQAKCEKHEYEMRVSAYITEQARKWEKTFPDMLYQEWGRLQNIDWKVKPKNWAQMTNVIYDMLGKDVSEKLIELDKNKSVDKHQYLTEIFGCSELRDRINHAIGLARGCETLQEYNAKMKLFFPNGSYQPEFSFKT